MVRPGSAATPAVAAAFAAFAVAVEAAPTSCSQSFVLTHSEMKRDLGTAAVVLVAAEPAVSVPVAVPVAALVAVSSTKTDHYTAAVPLLPYPADPSAAYLFYSSVDSAKSYHQDDIVDS